MSAQSSGVMAPSRDSGAPLSAPRLYLLRTLLLIGVVKSQSNFSEHLFNLAGQANSTTVINVTAKNMTLLDAELNHNEVEHNHTVVLEDEEGFQAWEDELQLGQCQEELLNNLSHVYCGQDFYLEMSRVRPEQLCSLEDVIRPYNEMTVCLETISNAVGCFYPNPIVQDLFLQVHAHFFRSCSRAEQDFSEPPSALVLTLTLLPVSLIPGLVYMALRNNHALN